MELKKNPQSDYTEDHLIFPAQGVLPLKANERGLLEPTGAWRPNSTRSLFLAGSKSDSAVMLQD